MGDRLLALFRRTSSLTVVHVAKVECSNRWGVGKAICLRFRWVSVLASMRYSLRCLRTGDRRIELAVAGGIRDHSNAITVAVSSINLCITK